jgi:hypothetical protein
MLIAAALLIATTSAVIANPQAGPQTAPAAPAASTDTLALPPNREVTSSIGMVTNPAFLTKRSAETSTIPSPERKVLMLLLGLCFIVMAVGGYALWRRSIEDLVEAKLPPSPSGSAATNSKLKN